MYIYIYIYIEEYLQASGKSTMERIPAYKASGKTYNIYFATLVVLQKLFLCHCFRSYVFLQQIMSFKFTYTDMMRKYLTFLIYQETMVCKRQVSVYWCPT